MNKPPLRSTTASFEDGNVEDWKDQVKISLMEEKVRINIMIDDFLVIGTTHGQGVCVCDAPHLRVKNKSPPL